MGKIEQELFDLEELLMRNDDVADRSIYITIVGIANDVSKLESENAKLRGLVRDIWSDGMTLGTARKLKAENDKLRELVYDIIVDEERGHNDDRTFSEHVSRAHEHGIAQDIEV